MTSPEILLPIDRPKILIVDDKKENLVALRATLDDIDADIIEALSGIEALSAQLTDSFSLVILDVQMPEMDGFEVAELMTGNKKTKDTPIIFVTAINKDNRYVHKAYGSGAVDYISKPYDPEILISKVNVFLNLFLQKRMIESQNEELRAVIHKMEALQSELEIANRNLTDLSVKDGLTRVYNRRHFDNISMDECKRAIRTKLPLTIIMVDIDHFKYYNDTYGHLSGDECLVKVAQCLSDVIKRPADVFARYGGEEFVFLLPDTQSIGAEHIAEMACKNVKGLQLPHKNSEVANVVTVSVGVSTAHPKHTNDVYALIKAADKALYAAKQAGRDQYMLTTEAPL